MTPPADDLLALDTSVAVPMLVRRHEEHDRVLAAIRHSTICLTGHSCAETYSVLTRLPGDARVAAADAARLLSSGFAPTLLVTDEVMRSLPATLAASGIEGGAVYDAMVALAVLGTDARLLTRDRRAASTYAALGVPFRFA